VRGEWRRKKEHTAGKLTALEVGVRAKTGWQSNPPSKHSQSKARNARLETTGYAKKVTSKPQLSAEYSTLARKLPFVSWAKASARRERSHVTPREARGNTKRMTAMGSSMFASRVWWNEPRPRHSRGSKPMLKWMPEKYEMVSWTSAGSAAGTRPRCALPPDRS